MTLPQRMKFGIFLAPFHPVGENPTVSFERNLELIRWLDDLDYDEVWVGEHHSGGWETIASPEMFLVAAAERTKHIKLGTGVLSLPYHHPFMVAQRMVQLDHMTRGRAMLGVGPGALVSDAVMLGIHPPTQRPRMDESLGIILRLMKETEPITYKSDWFEINRGLLHLRPYTKPHMPIAVAASQSPSGMILGGKYGIGILSISVPRGSSVALPGIERPSLKDFWNIAEEAAEKYGKVVDRHEWKLVLNVHIAESRKEAFAQARKKAGLYQQDYLEGTLGNASGFDGPADKLIDYMVEQDQWCVGTPDDLIDFIYRLDEMSGGFGGLLIQSTEWGTREQVKHSYELISRYVMPHFQDSLVNLDASQKWVSRERDELQALRREALSKVQSDYQKSNARREGH